MDATQFPEPFTSITGLGVPVSYYPVKQINRWGKLAASFLFLVGGLAALLYGVYDAYNVAQQHGPAVIDEQLTAPAVIALVLFIFGMLAAWSTYAAWNKAAAVYERGFASRDRKRVQTWHWEDVALMFSAVTRHYTNGIYTGTTHVYTLVRRDRAKLVLNDSLTGVEELARTIGQKIFPLLYEHAARYFATHQTLTFGPVVVNTGGILVGKKSFPWNEIQQIAIRQGILRIKRKDGGRFSGSTAAASAIPNLPVLLALIDQVIDVKMG